MRFHSNSDPQVLFMGYLFPDELEKVILDQPLPPVQTQRYGLALLNALKEGFNSKIEAFSTAQLLDFPQCRILIAPKAKWKTNDGISVTMVPFVNLVGIKHLSSFLATIPFVIIWILKKRNFNRIIIFHGVQNSKLWAVLVAQFFGKCTTIPVITDDLAIPQKWEGRFTQYLRRLDLRIIKRGLQKVTGVIVMAPKLAEKLAPGIPMLCIPTIHNTNRKPIPLLFNKNDNDEFNIVYTGGLTHDYGIDLLLDAFKKAHRNNWHLMISGWGDLETTVREFAASNPQVQFLGLVNSEELSELYSHADVLVTPKLSTTFFAELSFPSKIVEYLGTGKPVVSTNLPVFDENFKKHLILTRSDTPEELIRCFDEVESWNSIRLEKWSTENLRFVREELSPFAQGAKIRNFIDGIN